ncbi:MAG: thiamine pyrophosphate-binding protein [bacterium]|nr:thiamine pyrophosphate-binding protein [bacterium]
MQNLAEKHIPFVPEEELRVQTEATVVAALIEHLADLGIERAFGVSGGAIALLFDALAEHDSIELHHFRHETGAAFAAAEAYFASGKPTMVFTTTGPGTLNCLTGITAARWDGAKVVLITGSTSAAQRGRWATQETSSYTMPQDVLYTQGQIFDFAVRMESPSEFPEVVRRLSLGLARPGGFIAHVCLPMGIQSKRVDLPRKRAMVTMACPTVTATEAAACAQRLGEGPFAVWVGFGASEAADLVETLVERTGAKVFCSPRGKGIIPEHHPNFLGVTGLGGHEAVTDYMVQEKPRWVLVLGTRLGEATSFWDRDLTPSEGFIHVDLDPDVPGTAFPDAPTLGIQADIGNFLSSLLEHLPESPPKIVPASYTRRWDEPFTMQLKGREPVRPQVLMQSIQRLVVQESDTLVMAECGNSFAWANHYLRFPSAGRYRVSTLFGSMGHAATGVVGAAIARGGKALAILGDGSMLMNSEISTAVQYQAPAVWVVLNDSGYGMCRDGHRALGLTDDRLDLPQVDFTALARSMGADGVLVKTEDEVDSALQQALDADGPFVVDVHIDTFETSPLLKRFESLINQGSSKNVAGWEA